MTKIIVYLLNSANVPKECISLSTVFMGSRISKNKHISVVGLCNGDNIFSVKYEST
jgi:hypothetical protein